jgi:tetratricopeptide (TPR) repeat protein
VGVFDKARNKIPTAKETWTRADVIRQFELLPRVLAAWESQGLVSPKEQYHFEDLLEIRVLLRLKELGVSARKLKDAFASIRQKLQHVANPLAELRVFVEGKRIQVQAAGKKMEALSGQFVLDFDQQELKRLLTFPGNQREEADRLRKAKAEADTYFQQGLELEQNGADKREALKAYEKALELNPNLGGALVNIGTIYFNARKWRESEKFYQRAIEGDDTYPLAHFNLANLHEELGRTSLAIQHYKRAIELQPSYADAHYNLALLFQTRGRGMEAMRHWRQYLKLDPASHWAAIAKREMAKLRQNAIVSPKKAEPTG